VRIRIDVVTAVACHPSKNIIASVALEKVRSLLCPSVALPCSRAATDLTLIDAQDATVKIWFDTDEYERDPVPQPPGEEEQPRIEEVVAEGVAEGAAEGVVAMEQDP
jgi:hypothetical protein